VKTRIWEIVEVSAPGDHVSRAFDIFILTLILTNVIAVIVSTVPWAAANWGPFLRSFEIFSVAIFTVEYVLRVWSASADSRYAHPLFGRLRFILTPMALIDFLAVAPFYVTSLGIDLRFFRILRLARIFRVAKLGRYVLALAVLGRVFRSKKEELAVTSVLMIFLLVLASSFMYYAENAAQPEHFTSIPATMWWAVATLTTVGYGDVYPVTAAGKFLASIVAMLGIGLFALPTGILGSGFVEEMQNREENRRCPHCGKEID
jgi:voltage-gated potassium channel